MKYLTIPCLLVLCAGCGVTTDTPLSPEVTTQLENARRHLSQGDPDSALRITDRLLEQDGNLREARLLAAEANVAVIGNRAKITQSLKESLLHDAARNYRLALEIYAEDPASWDSLADVYRMQGEYKSGTTAALEAAARYRGRDQEAFARSLLRAAENELKIFKIARNAELQSEDDAITPDTEIKARIVLSRLEAVKQTLPGIGYLRASEVHRWLGRAHDEIDNLERGIRAEPDYFDIHQRYRELRAGRGEEAQCVSFYRTLLRDGGMNAGIAYSRGVAETMLADKHRRAGDRDAAERAYIAAVKSFESCKRSKPTWKSDCDHWIAVEYLSLAKIHEEAGNLAVSRGHLEKAIATTPRVAQVDADGRPLIMDSFRSYYFGTMMHIGRAIASASTEESQRDGLEFWEHFIALHPEQHGWMYNNAAFNARDLGIAIENTKGTDAEVKAAALAASKLYERSYALYKIGARLDPTDARTVNDQGLMLIYHLKRDYDLAEKLFNQAIRVGLVELKGLPEATTRQDRDLLEESIGDAYQNLGKLYMDLGKTFGQYSVPLRESLKYFPKQRRESARWLRRGARPAATQNKKPKQDARAKAFKSVDAEAKKMADTKDWDGALLVLDKASKQMIGFAPYHYFQGLYALRYATQAIANGGGIGQIDGLFADARNNLQKSVELDGEPIEPRLHLAEANYESREFENASKITAALVLHISSRGDVSDELIAATQRLRALSSLELYVAGKKTRNDEPEELQSARNAFRNLERMNRLAVETRQKWSELERWAGDYTAALDIFIRAVRKSPADQTLLRELVNAAAVVQQSARAVSVLAKRVDAPAMWWAGMAHYNSSFEKPIVDKPADTLSALGKAITKFELSAALNTSYKASCDQCIGRCHGAKGFHALARRNFAEAETQFLAAAERSPAYVHDKISGERSVKTGIELVVHHHYSNNDLGAAVKTLEKTCAVIKNDPTLSNNLGLFARDHGKSREAAGDATEATRLFEVSFKAYTNAVRLEPKSVRQRNDLIVMILYHVKRDLDNVVETLTSCIADGEVQLADDPPEDDQTLQDLQEAVGDSYENLGYYYMNFGEDKKLARKNFAKSLEFWPNRRRRGVRWILQLDNDK